MNASEEEEINSQLEELEGVIFSRIQSIREVINDEDRWVAEEIAMKKQTTNELSILYIHS
jgi:hypothetical protein